MLPKIVSNKTQKFMNNILDDLFYDGKPICQIIPTNCEKKIDIFREFRPERRTCLDYSISQTDVKMDAGDTKIHVQNSIASYDPYLAPPLPPKQIKVKRYFSGGPPQWEFADEKWRKKQEKLQIMYQQQLKERIALRKAEEKRKRKLIKAKKRANSDL